ncbi:MAG: glycosyl hydrolase family 17 [Cyclobacteriaceae bacterium]|nr:glycosyl hydrolase family 17 [Cyclobacteriaceae bacterium]
MNSTLIKSICIGMALMAAFSCSSKKREDSDNTIKQKEVTAKDILGNPAYQAISYEGYRAKSREIQPTVAQLKEDVKILHAMGIRLLRTYNVQFAHASNLLKAISEIKAEDPSFEMYLMLGAWIDCKNAWTDLEPDHDIESEQNEEEINRAVALANQYPDIVKVLAVGNEAMVKWATSYYVQPSVILKWVNYLQSLKAEGKLPKDLWITNSDDFSSWGGGGHEYHTEDLNELIRSVDFISMHTYPYHNSHYNPEFWRVPVEESKWSEIEKVDAAMMRALEFAKSQYDSVTNYMKSLGVNKPVHIGETGWATISDGLYGPDGSRATDEYKQALYYRLMREWTNKAGISCFFFEGFNEPWKDAGNPIGSENHFGLFTEIGEAKYAIWDLVDQGVFESLTRDGNPIRKSFGGDSEKLLQTVMAPPFK